MYLSNNLKIRVKSRCRGPASAGCRGPLRMNRVERERDRERDRERETRLACAAGSGNALVFTVSLIP